MRGLIIGTFLWKILFRAQNKMLTEEEKNIIKEQAGEASGALFEFRASEISYWQSRVEKIVIESRNMSEQLFHGYDPHSSHFLAKK